MRWTVFLLVVLILIAPATRAQTEPVTKRAVFSAKSTVQAKALAQHVTTGTVYKEFFVAYGGEVYVEFQVRSNGLHQVDWEAYFGANAPGWSCSGSTSSATYQGFNGCGMEVDAGAVVRVYFHANGQEGAICCARMKFHLVDVDHPAVVRRD